MKHAKRMVSLVLTGALVGSLSATVALAQEEPLHATSVQYLIYPEAQNTATALQFENLREVILDYNYTVYYLKAAMSDASEVDSDQIYEAVAALETLKGTLEALQLTAYNASLNLGDAYGGFSNVSGENIDVDIGDLSDSISSDLGILYATLNNMFYVEIASLDSQISSLDTQALTLDNTIEATKNTLNGSINQLVKGAEALYIGIVTLETALGDIDRGIAAMERAIALFDAQYQRGMVSLFEVESMQYQLRMLQSQRESLVFQQSTMKMSLEGMCGMERTGTVYLSEITLPTQEELDAVDYDDNLSFAQRQNVDVMNAEMDYSSNFNDATYKRAYTMALDNFQSSFYLTCLTVAEKSRLVSAAEDTVGYQARALEIAEKSYTLGMGSEEEYRTAQDSLSAAQSDLYKAQLDELSAYRDYIWAITYGIVS